MISEDFINNILIGVRRWVNNKIENISEVISLYINNIIDRLEDVEAVTDTINETVYNEAAVNATYQSGNVTVTYSDKFANGKVFKHGSLVTLYVRSANTVPDQQDVYYTLPYAPDSNYEGLHQEDFEYNGIQFKVIFTTQTVSGETYNVLKLNRYVNGSISNWESNQTVAFKIDYIASTQS